MAHSLFVGILLTFAIISSADCSPTYEPQQRSTISLVLSAGVFISSAFAIDMENKAITSILSSLFKFRMWFKYGLKAQKLLAQGSALGIIV